MKNIRLGDGGMAANSLFKHSRINIESTRDDYFFDSVDDEEITLLIEVAEISRVQASLVIEHRRGLFGLLPVSRHYLRTAHADFSELAARQNLLRFN